MSSAEETAAAAINKQASEVVKAAKKFKFQEVGALVATLKVEVEKANKLPGANPHLDPEEIEYPFTKQSAYLAGDRSQDVIAKIEAVVPAHRCNCDPVKCQCSSSEEKVSQEKGTACQFCNLDIPVGTPLHISEATGAQMCAVCARILWEKVRLKESVAYAVINLVQDACTEADPPYFQFKEALKLLEESQRRLEQFRLEQRAKVSR